MSTPISGEQPRGALAYAPKWARQQATEADFICPTLEEIADDLPPPVLIAKEAAEQHVPAQDVVRENPAAGIETAKNATSESAAAKVAAAKTAVAKGTAPGKPWWRGKPPIFEGDSAILELRERLRLAPDQIPEPPLRRTTPVMFGAISRLTIVAVAAAGAWGCYSFWAPREQAAPPLEALSHERLPVGSAQAAVVLPATADPGELAAVPRAPAATLRPIEPLAWPASQGNDTAGDVAAGSGTSARGLSSATPAETQTSAPLTARPREVEAARANAMRTPSVGASTTDAPAPNDSTTAVAAATTSVPAAPTAATPRQPPLDAKEAEALLARAQTYLTNGDVAAARLMLRRAAEAGVARAALALGDTYEPQVLKQLGVVGILGDLNEARVWYRRAAELGSTDAPQRLLAENRGPAVDGK